MVKEKIKKLAFCLEHKNYKVPLIQIGMIELWCPYCGEEYQEFIGGIVASPNDLEKYKTYFKKTIRYRNWFKRKSKEWLIKKGINWKLWQTANQLKRR